MNNLRTARTVSVVLAVLVAAGTAITVAVGLAHEPTVVHAGVPLHQHPGATPNQPTPESPPSAPPPTTAPTPATPPATRPPTAAEPVVSLHRGDHGGEVRDLQHRLRDLGYWLGEPDGSFELLTEQAVTAFEKVEGLAPDGVAGPSMRAALAVAARPLPASAAGNLLEVDKARQVVFVVRDGTVAWTLNTSTGTEKPYQLHGRTELADTPVGRWTVTWAVDGVQVGALGALYRPRYFHPDGIAVHGYHSVPAEPASHGCVRVTEAAIDWIWANDVLPIGSRVWVR